MLLICKKVVYLQNALEILKEESERKLHFGDTGTKCPSVKGEELWVGLGAGGWDESRGPAAGRAGGHWESRMEPGMEGGGCGGPSC